MTVALNDIILFADLDQKASEFSEYYYWRNTWSKNR